MIIMIECSVSTTVLYITNTHTGVGFSLDQNNATKACLHSFPFGQRSCGCPGRYPQGQAGVYRAIFFSLGFPEYSKFSKPARAALHLRVTRKPRKRSPGSSQFFWRATRENKTLWGEGGEGKTAHICLIPHFLTYATPYNGRSHDIFSYLDYMENCSSPTAYGLPGWPAYTQELCWQRSSSPRHLQVCT